MKTTIATSSFARDGILVFIWTPFAVGLVLASHAVSGQFNQPWASNLVLLLGEISVMIGAIVFVSIGHSYFHATSVASAEISKVDGRVLYLNHLTSRLLDEKALRDLLNIKSKDEVALEHISNAQFSAIYVLLQEFENSAANDTAKIIRATIAYRSGGGLKRSTGQSPLGRFGRLMVQVTDQVFAIEQGGRLCRN